MKAKGFSASGNSFSVHEWRGSGPATLHVHHSDDEAWHVLEGDLTFRYADRTEAVGPGGTVFVPAGMPHTYSAAAGARYLINLNIADCASDFRSSGRSRSSSSARHLQT